MNGASAERCRMTHNASYAPQMVHKHHTRTHSSAHSFKNVRRAVQTFFCAYADKECEPRQLLIFLIRAPTHKRRPMNEWRRKWHFNQSIAEQSKHDKSRSHIIGPWLVVGNQFTATRSRKDGMSGEVRPRLYQQLITRRKNESVRWARTFQGLPPRDVSLPCLRRVDFFLFFSLPRYK